LVQGFESKHLVMEYTGDGESYLRGEWNTGVRLWIGCIKLVRLAKLLKACIIQCYGVPIYRIQYGIKCLHLNGEDWIIKWNLVLITSADNLKLLRLLVELGLEPRQKWNSIK